MTEDGPFRVEVAVDAPRGAVWRALSERDELRRWFGWDYEGLSEEIDFIFFEHATRHAPDRIEFEDGAGGRRIELVADGPRRTLLRATKPAEGAAPAGDELYDGEREGWRAFFGQLDHYLANHDGEERRTISMTGEAAPGAALALLEGRAVRASSFVALADLAAEGFAAVEARADLDSSEPAQIRFTISAYGLDDQAFEALRARWAERWGSVASAADVTN
ncbi:MAG: SRPBCC domain-containing protein [Thermoleophilaceae bacterium]